MNNQLVTLLLEYNALKLWEQIDYDKFYLYSLITHSTAIEGSTVTEIENQLLFDEGISAKGRSITEQMMNLDLKKAYEKEFELAKNKTPFTTELLCELSALVMKNTGGQYNSIKGSFDSSKGELRLVNVSAGVGGTSYLPFEKVPLRLKVFCEDLNQKIKNVEDDILKKYELSFEAHYKLVTIHTWADGNGRMSRLVMNMIQLQFGLLPVKINKENKAEYIKALQQSRDKDNCKPFIDFMILEHCNNLKTEIKDYKESQNVVVNTKNVVVNVVASKKQERLQLILQMLKENPKITASEIAKDVGKTTRTIQRDLAKLTKQNKITRTGSDKTGKWIVREL